jgi:hypothetical protein
VNGVAGGTDDAAVASDGGRVEGGRGEGCGDVGEVVGVGGHVGSLSTAKAVIGMLRGWGILGGRQGKRGKNCLFFLIDTVKSCINRI